MKGGDKKLSLTEKRVQILRAAAAHDLGLVSKPHLPGFEGVAWRKNADYLVANGLLAPYVHGGFEITSDGRAIVAKTKDHCASNSQHTSGPWYLSETLNETYCVRQESTDAVIASIEDGCHVSDRLIDWSAQEANARLIAAAPDMLTALKALLERYALAIGNEGPEAAAARLAIAKAEGGAA